MNIFKLLRGDPPISLRAVGDTLGYSRELIRAIEHRAINTLRKCKDVNQLKQFI